MEHHELSLDSAAALPTKGENVWVYAVMAKLYYKTLSPTDTVTMPVVMKPSRMTRRQWRDAIAKGKRAMKKHAKAEERRPEAEKIDDRLHAAGLISPRDVAAVCPVRFGTQVLGA